MYKPLLCLLLTMHVIGDFYFRDENPMKKKRNAYISLLLHGCCYLMISVICVLPFYSVSLLVTAAALAGSHFIVDNVKYVYCAKKKKKIRNSSLYLIDQIIHLAFIVVAVLILVCMGYKLKAIPIIEKYLPIVADSVGELLKWAVLILLAHKPANISIRLLTEKYKPEDSGEGKSVTSDNAGAFIGTLERLIILVMISIGQYAAIGLVLTAKSIARYNKISEDKQFAEYYLLGTLLSTLYAIVVFQILNL